MAVEICFETHALSEDNERGVATGWLPGRLSDRGREQARQLGERRLNDGFSAVLTSDLHRSLETAIIGFGSSGIPVLADWRLRECDYGRLNGADGSLVHGAMRLTRLHTPYPDGESWSQAVDRVAGVFPEIAARWAGRRILVIGHKATGWALRHVMESIEIAELLSSDYGMPRGREYVLRELPATLCVPIALWHRAQSDTTGSGNA